LDFMPTLLGLLGLSVPTACQGVNHAAAWRAKNDTAAESVPFFYFAGNWRGVYTRRYTYAFDLPGGEVEASAKLVGRKRYACLYDHEQDPRELKNLYDAPECKALREELHAQALAWMKKFGDTGLLIGDLISRVMVAEDIGPSPNRGDGSFGQGRLKSRPIEVLTGK
jgi:arylsulfatase A-like enzyme